MHTKRVPLTAQNLSAHIIAEIALMGGHAYQVFTTGIPDGRGGFRKNPSAGVSDLVACINGKYIGIEIKIGKDRQSEVQKLHEKNIKNAGGQYHIVKTPKDWEILKVRL